jgi:N-acetylgalactosamine-N,N'-diacetylbacillosaminyl-diphospho-undecaprenol 4-alpha-N-acetylgalactosaminyltransferase
LKKIKIAFLINSFGLGGAERVVSLLLEKLKIHPKYEFELILLEDEYFYEVPEGVKNTTLSTLTWKDSTIKRTLYIPILSYRLNRYIKKNEIDFVLSFIYRSDFVNIITSFFSKHKFAISNRVSASSTYSDDSFASNINNFLIKKLYPKAPLIINVSHGVQQDLIDNYHIDRSKQKVIHNPYNIKKIEQLANENLELKTQRYETLLVASRLDSVKNISMILEVFAILEKNLQLVIIGDGAEKKNLEKLSKILDIDKRVHFMGLQNNPYKYMKNATIYISASNSEGFPNALVEAMFCKCSVISTDCISGPREILAPKSDLNFQLQEGLEITDQGILTATHDKIALKDGIEYLLQDKKRLKTIAQNGYKRAHDFDRTVITQAYIDAIKEVL